MNTKLTLISFSCILVIALIFFQIDIQDFGPSGLMRGEEEYSTGTETETEEDSSSTEAMTTSSSSRCCVGWGADQCRGVSVGSKGSGGWNNCPGGGKCVTQKDQYGNTVIDSKSGGCFKPICVCSSPSPSPRKSPSRYKPPSRYRPPSRAPSQSKYYEKCSCGGGRFTKEYNRPSSSGSGDYACKSTKCWSYYCTTRTQGQSPPPNVVHSHLNNVPTGSTPYTCYCYKKPKTFSTSTGYGNPSPMPSQCSLA